MLCLIPYRVDSRSKAVRWSRLGNLCANYIQYVYRRKVRSIACCDVDAQRIRRALCNSFMAQSPFSHGLFYPVPQASCAPSTGSTARTAWSVARSSRLRVCFVVRSIPRSVCFMRSIVPVHSPPGKQTCPGFMQNFPRLLTLYPNATSSQVHSMDRYYIHMPSCCNRKLRVYYAELFETIDIQGFR